MPYEELPQDLLDELAGSGVGLILAEKLRQIQQEGFTLEHDAGHNDNSLVWAAIHYAAPRETSLLVYNGIIQGRPVFEEPWPKSWSRSWDKKKRHDRIKQLAIAGALIASELDRLAAEEARRTPPSDDPDFFESDTGRPSKEFKQPPPPSLLTDDLVGTFGEREMELAAKVIVQMAVQARSWDIMFSVADFANAPNDKAGYAKDGFEDLILHHWILRSGRNFDGQRLFRVCYEFVARLAKKRPHAFSCSHTESPPRYGDPCLSLEAK